MMRFFFQNMYDFCCVFAFFFTNFSILPSIVVAVYASLLHKSDCAFSRGYVHRDEDVDNDHDDMCNVPSHRLLLCCVFLFCFIYSFSHQRQRQPTNTARRLYIKKIQRWVLVL